MKKKILLLWERADKRHNSEGEKDFGLLKRSFFLQFRGPCGRGFVKYITNCIK